MTTPGPGPGSNPGVAGRPAAYWIAASPRVGPADGLLRVLVRRGSGWDGKPRWPKGQSLGAPPGAGSSVADVIVRPERPTPIYYHLYAFTGVYARLFALACRRARAPVVER